jgi:hypothetical protein
MTPPGASNAWYSAYMSRDTKGSIEDDLSDAIEEDERAELVAELRRRGFVDAAEEW